MSFYKCGYLCALIMKYLPPWPSKTAKREDLLSERGDTEIWASSM